MKFFVTDDKIENNTITITGDDVVHIRDVLRLSESSIVKICDGNYNDYTCELISLTKKHAKFKIQSKAKNNAEPLVDVILYQSLPKNPKIEIIIQKCVEIGIKEIVFFPSERSVQKIKDEMEIQKKLQRFNKISKAAAMQSGRGIVPNISFIPSFNMAISATKNGVTIIAYEACKELTLKQFMTSFCPVNMLNLIIGPEGGFTEAEINYAKNANATVVTLGKRILRTETAAIVTTAIVLNELES